MRLSRMNLPQPRSGSPRPWFAALCVGAVLLMPGLAAAQDSDDDGVLPYTPTNTTPSTGGSSTSSDTAGNVVGLTTAVEATQVEPAVAHVRVHPMEGQAAIAENVPAEEATFAAKPGTVLAQPSGNDLLLQGEGTLIAPEALPMTIEAAPSSVARVAVLLLDDSTASLHDLLTGHASPDQILVLGNVSAVGLQGFQSIVTHHSQDLPGVHATLVFLSVDTHGQLHVSAVRASTDGGPLELVTH